MKFVGPPTMPPVARSEAASRVGSSSKLPRGPAFISAVVIWTVASSRQSWNSARRCRRHCRSDPDRGSSRSAGLPLEVQWPGPGGAPTKYRSNSPAGRPSHGPFGR